MGLRPAAVFVCPGQEIDSAGFADCFTVEAALSLNVCLFYSMTLLGKLLPMVVVVVGGAFVGWGGGVGAQTRNTCTRRQATALLFALAEETLRSVEFFFLPSLAVKAQIYHGQDPYHHITAWKEILLPWLACFIPDLSVHPSLQGY